MPRFRDEPPDRWELDLSATRLARTAGADPAGIFTAHLSAAEYALLGQAGFEPLSLVTGSSTHPVREWPYSSVSGREFCELPELTQAITGARELAMSRMRAEADYLRADGIVGVSLHAQESGVHWRLVDFVATGTAIRAVGGSGESRAPDGRAFTSGLSTQDLFRLLAAGAVPVAFVFGLSVYGWAGNAQADQQARGYAPGQEMARFSQALHEARDLVLARMQAQAARARSAGIVDVTVTHSRFGVPGYAPGGTEFQAAGTAIRRLAGEDRPPGATPKPTFTLGLDA